MPFLAIVASHVWQYYIYAYLYIYTYIHRYKFPIGLWNCGTFGPSAQAMNTPIHFIQQLLPPSHLSRISGPTAPEGHPTAPQGHTTAPQGHQTVLQGHTKPLRGHTPKTTQLLQGPHSCSPGLHLRTTGRCNRCFLATATLLPHWKNATPASWPLQRSCNAPGCWLQLLLPGHSLLQQSWTLQFLLPGNTLHLQTLQLVLPLQQCSWSLQLLGCSHYNAPATLRFSELSGKYSDRNL